MQNGARKSEWLLFGLGSSLKMRTDIDEQGGTQGWQFDRGHDNEK